MKRTLLALLECPRCHEEYALTVESEEQKEVMEGQLTCSCGHFPISRGVPRLLPQAVDARNWKTAARFGEEWKQFSMITDEYERQFLSWIEPVKKEDFVGKVVLDMGCGKGRHVLQSTRFGAAQVVGIDLSDTVDVAFDNVGRMEGVHIIQADIYNLPLKPLFDYAYSIGVLHHTPDPAASFQCMVDKVKPGGTVSAWVYGREGNGWIIYLLNPVRRITSWLPLSITKTVAFFLAVILQTALRLIYLPVERNASLHWFKPYLPYSAYLCSIAGYSFRENFSIVFDHLLPEIAFYIRRSEFRRWFYIARLQEVTITPRFANSWRGFGRKSAREETEIPSMQNGYVLSPALLEKRVLNLGCGNYPMERALNVDIRPETGCDVLMDLNKPEEIQRLPHGHYDRISLFHVLEHLDDAFKTVHACTELLKPGGILHIRVPHASRGFTHSEHKHGFDAGFPHYFNPALPTFYYGTALELVSMRLDWAIRFDIYRQIIPLWQVYILWFLNAILTPLANISPGLCSRLWCYWVGGFEQIEYVFRKPALSESVRQRDG